MQKIHSLTAAGLFTLTLIALNMPLAYAAPSVTITSPAANAIITDPSVNITAQASTGALGVQFKLNGSNYGAEDTVAPYSVSWNAAGAVNTPHNITAVARYTTGKVTSPVVTVQNYQAPFAGTTMVVGDSVSQQAFDPDGDNTQTFTQNAPASSLRNIAVKMGWAVPDVQQHVTNYSIFHWPERLVVALGANDASPLFGADGWTDNDLQNFRTLINTPHISACVVLVLPYAGPTANPAWAAEIEKARSAITALASERAGTYVADWKTVVDKHPEYMDEDGIHLLTPNTTPQEDLIAASEGRLNPVDPIAAAARQEFYWKYATQCEAPSTTFQAPADNATVEGTVPLEVNAIGAESVQFNVDGQDIGSAITETPYRIEWDSTTMPDGTPASNGLHTITALSTNPAGSHTATIQVNVQNPPVPGSVGLIGDSVTLNSLNSTGTIYEQTFFGNKPENLMLSYWMGWAHSDSLASVKQWAANRNPEILVDAYGINDAKPYHSYWKTGDGFTAADQANVLTLLNTTHNSSCKVLVLPGWGNGLGETAYEQQHIAELNKVRSFYQGLETQRNDIVLVDWQAIVNAHPEYMDSDGVHLAPKPDGSSGWLTEAAEARQTMYWDGVAQCQTLLASRS